MYQDLEKFCVCISCVFISALINNHAVSIMVA